MNSVLTVIGLACVDTGFREALFKAGQASSSVELMRLAGEFGISLTFDELTRVKHLTRKVDTTNQKEQDRLDKAKGKVRGRLKDKVRNKLEQNLQPDKLAEKIAEGLVDDLLFNSPGSLEGVFGFTNDVLCPVWPCDPLEP
jgi:hypothetical protein